jgi:hypothetical protein
MLVADGHQRSNCRRPGGVKHGHGALETKLYSGDGSGVDVATAGADHDQ